MVFILWCHLIAFYIPTANVVIEMIFLIFTFVLQWTFSLNWNDMKSNWMNTYSAYAHGWEKVQLFFIDVSYSDPVQGT